MPGWNSPCGGKRCSAASNGSDKPVLVAINGTCVGGGLELAWLATFGWPRPERMLGLPEIKLGLIPGFGGTQRLPRVIGPSKAAEMILTGENLSVAEDASEDRSRQPGIPGIMK